MKKWTKWAEDNFELIFVTQIFTFLAMFLAGIVYVTYF